jgi:hypothetical protein
MDPLNMLNRPGRMLTDSEKDEDYFFYSPAGLAALDHLDATEVLAGLWERRMPSDDEEDSDRLAANRGPFSSQFPGLAPGADTKLNMARLHEALRHGLLVSQAV